MPNELIPIKFHDDTIYCVDYCGQPYAPVRPIVENLGLSWASQTVKLNENRERWGCFHIETPSAGGVQKTLCLPVRKLTAYLFSINANKVREDLRAKLIRYQNECNDVLWEYWTTGRVDKKIHASEEEDRCLDSKTYSISSMLLSFWNNLWGINERIIEEPQIVEINTVKKKVNATNTSVKYASIEFFDNEKYAAFLQELDKVAEEAYGLSDFCSKCKDDELCEWFIAVKVRRNRTPKEVIEKKKRVGTTYKKRTEPRKIPNPNGETSWYAKDSYFLLEKRDLLLDLQTENPWNNTGLVGRNAELKEMMGSVIGRLKKSIGSKNIAPKYRMKVIEELLRERLQEVAATSLEQVQVLVPVSVIIKYWLLLQSEDTRVSVLSAFAEQTNEVLKCDKSKLAKPLKPSELPITLINRKRFLNCEQMNFPDRIPRPFGVSTQIIDALVFAIPGRNVPADAAMRAALEPFTSRFGGVAESAKSWTYRGVFVPKYREYSGTIVATMNCVDFLCIVPAWLELVSSDRLRQITELTVPQVFTGFLSLPVVSMMPTELGAELEPFLSCYGVTKILW